ncbi:excinuclease ATPase subunit [Bacteroides sp. CAG:875]|nr:excinuclease ATPase subunit [Bacteroides sp. CAG:875]
MIKRIKITELYGLYSYDIVIPEKQNLTILTGPNGYGKTTILHIIEHLLQCEFWFFYFLDFKNITISFDTNKFISISKNSKQADNRPNYIAQENETEEIETSDSKPIQVDIKLAENTINQINEIETFSVTNIYIQRLRRSFARPTLYDENNSLDLAEILETNYKLKEDTYLENQCRSLFMFLQEHKCNFVKEQRIITPNLHSSYERRRITKDSEYTIDSIAQELKDFYAHKQFEFAIKSQRIDTSFIQRLVNEECQTYEDETFYKKLEKLKERLRSYQNYGLIRETNILEKYPNELKKVLSLYLNDMENKIEVFDLFYKQLSTFDRFVSEKALSHKYIRLNTEKGICVYNEQGNEIPLHKLSSGEQNLIILYYKLIFTGEKNTILLIDEPENSLHVAWLDSMLEDYKQIVEKLGCQIIIATHSPTLIGDNWEITCDLYDNNQTEK